MANDDKRADRGQPEPAGTEEAESEDSAGATHSHHDEHRGDFAEGQTSTHVPSDALRGDFAQGQEEQERSGATAHRGDFAEGQTGTHVSPDARRGDYAEGDEDTHSDERR